MARISTHNEDFEDFGMQEVRKREAIEKYDSKDPLGTRTQLEQDFMKFLEKKQPSIKYSKTEGTPSETEAVSNINVEGLLNELYEVRDGLIDSINGMPVNSTSKNIAKQINRIGSCINTVGGKAEEFDLLSCVSGLQALDQNKSVQRVIDNTKQAYSLGEISNAEIVDQRTIKISFSGKFITRKGDALYRADGTIKAKRGFAGGEAIDFIHTIGEGRMSVKAFEGDRWVDKSEDYDIEYRLKEWLAYQPTKQEETKPVENKGNNDSQKEVMASSTEPVKAENTEVAENEKLNFPIIEKENKNT